MVILTKAGLPMALKEGLIFMRSKKGLKILISIVAAIVILLLLVSLAVKIIFTKEKLLSLVVPKIEQALNRKVKIDDVSVSIFGGLGVDIKGMHIFNPDGFAEKEFLKFDQLLVRVKFWPLLRKRVEVKKLILKNPLINLEKNKEGFSNFDDLLKGEGGFFLPVAFDQMEIKDGKVTYSDEKDEKRIVLDKFQEMATLSLDETMENIRATGKISVDQIELDLPKYKGKLPPLTFSLEHDLNLNVPGDSLNLNVLKLSIAKVSLDLKGKVEKLSSVPFMNLEVTSNEIPLEDVLASMPKEESSPLNQLKASGKMNVTAALEGEMKKATLPQIQGKIFFSDVKIDFAQVPQPFIMPYGEVNFNNRSVSLFSSGAKLGETPLEFKAVVEDFKDPHLVSELKMKFDLALLGEFKKMPQGTSLKGKTEIDAKAYGKLKKLQEMNLSGTVNLKDVEATTPALGVPARNLNADLSFKDGDVNINDLSLSLGQSSFDLQGRFYQAIPYFLFKGEKKPVLSFSLNSPLMDLDQIFPVSKEVKTKNTTAISDTILLPDINAKGQISVQKLIFRKIEFTNLSASLDVTDGILRIENVASNVYTGTIGGKAVCDLNDINNLKFNLDFNASQIEANDFLSRFTAVHDHLFGKLNLTASFSGMGNKVEDIQKSLTASGKATIADGKLVNWELLNTLASYLKVQTFKEEQIRTLRNSFRIESGRVWFDDFSASTKSGDFELSGSLGLDGSLNYQLTAVLSSELSSSFDALGDLSEYLKNDQGRVVLDINVRGTAKNPEFSLNTSKAEERFKKQMSQKLKQEGEKVTEELKKKGEDLLKDLFKKKKKE
jgi:AsmA protein